MFKCFNIVILDINSPIIIKFRTKSLNSLTQKVFSNLMN